MKPSYWNLIEMPIYSFLGCNKASEALDLNTKERLISNGEDQEAREGDWIGHLIKPIINCKFHRDDSKKYPPY